MMMLLRVVSIISKQTGKLLVLFDDHNTINSESDDEPLRGVAQEFDFGSNEEESEPEPQLISRKRSKQAERPKKIIPTASDESSSEEDDDDEPVTMANMTARSRELDALAAAEAEMDSEELHAIVENEDDDDDMATDGEEDADGDIDAEPFHLPTSAERDEEKAKGEPDVHAVQRRMRHCVRVLAKFNRRAEKGRSVLLFLDLTLIILIHWFSALVQNTQINLSPTLLAIMVTILFWQRSFSSCSL